MATHPPIIASPMPYSRQRFLLREMIRRELAGRYAGSALGLVWALLQPLWQLLLFHFVFSTVLRVPLTGERTDNFAIFLFCGLLPWLAIHEGLVRSSTAITDNANLVKKMTFPAELLVVSVILSALLHEALALVVFVAVLAALGSLSLASLPLLLGAVVLQLALTLGLGLLLAGLQVVLRDVVQLLGMALTIWFYCTPIVYPLRLVPTELRALLSWNPLSVLVGMYRRALLGGEPTNPYGLLVLVTAAGVLLSCGLWLFRRLKPVFADEI